MVADVSSATALAEKADVEKASEVVGRGGWRDVCFDAVAGAVCAADEGLFEGDDEAVGPAALPGELFEKGPAGGCLFDLLEPPAGLCEVRDDAEVDPLGGVAFWLVAAALCVLECVVVVGGVFAEVLLDRGELR